MPSKVNQPRKVLTLVGGHSPHQLNQSLDLLEVRCLEKVNQNIFSQIGDWTMVESVKQNTNNHSLPKSSKYLGRRSLETPQKPFTSGDVKGGSFKHRSSQDIWKTREKHIQEGNSQPPPIFLYRVCYLSPCTGTFISHEVRAFGRGQTTLGPYLEDLKLTMSYYPLTSRDDPPSKLGAFIPNPCNSWGDYTPPKPTVRPLKNSIRWEARMANVQGKKTHCF